jgi:hypothetical protein
MSAICSCLLRSFPRQGGSYLIRKIHGYRAGGSTRPIALPQEGVGPPGGHGGLAQHPRARYGLPCPVVALPLALPADCLTPGA